MPLFHVSYNWQQSNTRTGGYREGFWNNGTSAETVKARADILLAAFNQLKGEPVFCPSYIISNYPANRVALPVKTGFTAKTVTEDNEADYPSSKIQLQLKGTTGQKTNQWIGGIRDNSTKRGGFWVPTAYSVQKFNAVKAILESAANGWSLNVLNIANTPKVITAFNAQTGEVTTSVNHGFANDDYVRIQRLRGVDGINGIWQIRQVAATTFTLVGWPASNQVMTRSNARVQKQDHQPVTIIEARIVQMTSHKVGRPTDLLGGKRKRPSKSLVGPLVAK